MSGSPTAVRRLVKCWGGCVTVGPRVTTTALPGAGVTVISSLRVCPASTVTEETDVPPVTLRGAVMAKGAASRTLTTKVFSDLSSGSMVNVNRPPVFPVRYRRVRLERPVKRPSGRVRSWLLCKYS